MAWTRWLFRALYCSLVLNGVALAALALTYANLSDRQSFVLDAGPSLATAQREWMGVEKASVDDLVLFLHDTVPALHMLDDGGNPSLRLLKGTIEPSILTKAEERVMRNIDSARSKLIVQFLVPTRVSDVEEDESTGRIAAYYRGYLVTLIQSTNRFVLQPYRAQVVLTRNTPNRVNSRPFYLARIEERFGPKATEWDQESEGRKARR